MREKTPSVSDEDGPEVVEPPAHLALEAQLFLSGLAEVCFLSSLTLISWLRSTS